VDLNLWNELRALVDEIHTSFTLQHFKDSVDPVHSFHVQREEPIMPRDPVSAPASHQQEELNVASNILKALNSTRGLFNQPAACTIGLSARLCANSSPAPSALRDSPLTPIPTLMLLSSLHPPTMTMLLPTPSPTSMN
ncbi:hypothetical protein C0993_009926, partial [Termitomyces sp. T159_Od127]